MLKSVLVIVSESGPGIIRDWCHTSVALSFVSQCTFSSIEYPIREAVSYLSTMTKYFRDEQLFLKTVNVDLPKG